MRQGFRCTGKRKPNTAVQMGFDAASIETRETGWLKRSAARPTLRSPTSETAYRTAGFVHCRVGFSPPRRGRKRLVG